MEKKKAFTLAEVLITLGVIGIVAAMTLPTLVAKYEKLVIETSLKKTYSDLEKWVRRVEADYGTFDSWEMQNGGEEQFVQKYVSPYMKLRQCGEYPHYKIPCMVKNGSFSTWYKPTESKKPGILETNAQHMPKYILTDGRILGIYIETSTDWANPGKTLNIIIDVNGSKGKTIMGQDVFIFSLCNFRGITNRLKAGPGASWSENFTTEKLTSDCINSLPYVIFKGSACIHLLERNNWKFPKDYPIKF